MPGPEYSDTGDPQWIDVPLVDRGAFNNVDFFLPYGRWRERLYNSTARPLSAREVALHGLFDALQRAIKAISPDANRRPGDTLQESQEQLGRCG